MEICQSCMTGRLDKMDQVINLGDVLHRWEDEVGILFPPEVRRSYAEAIEHPIFLYKCDNCGFAPFLPIVSGTNDFYSSITSAEEEYYVKDKWEFRRALRDITKNECQSVLDFGCGSGEFLTRLSDKLDVQAYGFDFNPVGVSQAKSRGYDLLEDLSPRDEIRDKFDAITMFQVLEHLEAPFETIENLKFLLKPGGILIVSVPDASGPIHHFETALTELPPHHVTRWYGDSLQRCFSTRGFDVIDMRSEPLPEYLWDSYLPVMVERDLLPSSIGHLVNRLRITRSLIVLLRRMNIKSSPFRGHTLYGVFRKKTFLN